MPTYRAGASIANVVAGGQTAHIHNSCIIYISKTTGPYSGFLHTHYYALQWLVIFHIFEGCQVYETSGSLTDVYSFMDTIHQSIDKLITTLFCLYFRFLKEHPEVVPDLRDFRKPYRRVQFYGYHSSVCR